jgi:zinc transport system substrate-binding protein
MKNKFLSIFILIILTFVTCSCQEQSKDDRIKIVATIFPQYSFVKEIVGDLCDVEVVLKPGQDSHNFDPSVSTVINIKNADIFVYTSDEMETWAAKLIQSLNKNTIINASKGIEHLIVNEDDHEGHDHPEGEHIHNHSYDPHLWTSIRNSILMVENITKEICLRDPANSETYKANSIRYINELKEMDEAYIDLFGQCSQDHHNHPTLFFVCPFTFYYFIKEVQYG